MRRLRRNPLLWIVLVLQVVDQITVEMGHVLALLVVVQIIVDKNNKRRNSCNKHLIINAYGSELLYWYVVVLYLSLVKVRLAERLLQKPWR